MPYRWLNAADQLTFKQWQADPRRENADSKTGAARPQKT
jgi:hypothetical protein